MTIKEALLSLDPENTAQWTDDDLPKVEVVRELTGDPELTEEQIREADPEFCRDKATVKTRKPTKESIEKEIAELRKQRKALDELIIIRQRHLAELIEMEAKLQEQRVMTPIMAYVRSQGRLRAERMAAIVKSRERLHGVDPMSLNPKAPIDQAMVRKTGFGRERPQVRKPAAEGK